MKTLLLFFFISLAAFLFIDTNQAYAMRFVGPSNCFDLQDAGSNITCTSTAIVFCNDDATNWQVRAKYINWDGTLFSNLANNPGHATNESGYGCNGTGWTVWIDNYEPEAGDYIRWQTACIDPKTIVDVNYDSSLLNLTRRAGEPLKVYRTYVGFYNNYASVPAISCKAIGYNCSGHSISNCSNNSSSSTFGGIYAGCYHSGFPSKDWGNVASDAQCPYYDTSSSYCTKGSSTSTYTAYTDWSSSCSASYCGGTNNCTYYDKFCSGPSATDPTGCGHTTYPYDETNCGSSCSVPAPSVSMSCNGTSPRATVSWSAISGASSYDIQRRHCNNTGSSCSSWTGWTASTGVTSPYSLNLGTEDTLYQFQLRYHKSGRTLTYGNTATATTPSCSGPNLVVSSLSVPTGYAGNSGTASVTIQNTGNLTTGTSNFNVGFLADGSAATCSTTYSGTTATTPLAAGASRTVSVPFTYPSATGSHTGIAMVDSSCGVTESVETDNTRTVAYTVNASSITAHVYQDLNGNAAQDAGEPDYQGANISLSGPTSGTGSTDASGNVVFANRSIGSYSVNINPIPSNYTLTTPPNPKSTSLPPNQTVNFGIKPPSAQCLGGLTASPVTVNPGQTSTLTCNNPSGGGQGATYTYTWLTPSPGSITSTNPSTTNTATWQAPSPYWTDTYAYPSVSICQTGTTLCTPYAISNGLGTGGHGIHIVPLFSISGNIFVDQNKDTLQNGSDVNYGGTITLTSTGGSVTYPAPAGSYLVSNLPGGQYTISYTSLPARYELTYPVNGPPPSFTVRVGNASTGGACSDGGSNSASCDANGNITALKFGITNSLPWIQSIGGDITGGSVTDPSGGGFTDPIPSGATCGVYASLTGGGGSPGVIYSGAGSYDFGSGQASQNPYNWVVGGLNYPEPISITTPLITRYSYVYSEAQQSGNIKDISSYCGAGGINSCQLPSNLANGFYISNGNLTLTGPSYTFPSGKNYVILVNGDLNINTEIHVPIGSTAFFTTSGDIHVDQSVGESSVSSTRSNIEGYFSTDHFFYVEGIDACPTTDLRVNIAGAIVVNASLTGGSFVNQRDLCASDLQCPAISIIERPDFVLYSPEYLKIRRVWQEVAP